MIAKIEKQFEPYGNFTYKNKNNAMLTASLSGMSLVVITSIFTTLLMAWSMALRILLSAVPTASVASMFLFLRKMIMWRVIFFTNQRIVLIIYLSIRACFEEHPEQSV